MGGGFEPPNVPSEYASVNIYQGSTNTIQRLFL